MHVRGFEKTVVGVQTIQTLVNAAITHASKVRGIDF